jgi:hypothetical protein
MLNLAPVTPITLLKKKKSGPSHTKTIKNGIYMESTKIHWPFNEKKIPKNHCKLFLKSLWS